MKTILLFLLGCLCMSAYTFGQDVTGYQKVYKLVRNEVPESYEAQDTMLIAKVEQVPNFITCKQRYDINNQSSLKQCFDAKVKSHIAHYFDYTLSEKLKIRGANRIFVQYVVDQKGAVTNINVKAAHSQLEEEALRVMRLLPKVRPGQHKGKVVAVRCNTLISYEVKG